MNETLHILQQARARLASGWCAFSRGMDASGGYSNGHDPQTVRWCALGAIDGAVGRSWDRADKSVYEALAAELPWRNERKSMHGDIADFSNSQGQAAVLALFDRAIAKLQKPALRTDSELVADLMARVCGERIAEEA